MGDLVKLLKYLSLYVLWHLSQFTWPGHFGSYVCEVSEERVWLYTCPVVQRVILVFYDSDYSSYYPPPLLSFPSSSSSCPASPPLLPPSPFMCHG